MPKLGIFDHQVDRACQTSLSFHRESAEREARLLSDLERIFGTIEANRRRYDETQDRAFDELVRVVERRGVTEDEIGEALAAMRQQRRDGEF